MSSYQNYHWRVDVESLDALAEVTSALSVRIKELCLLVESNSTQLTMVTEAIESSNREMEDAQDRISGLNGRVRALQESSLSVLAMGAVIMGMLIGLSIGVYLKLTGAVLIVSIVGGALAANSIAAAVFSISANAKRFCHRLETS